MSVTTLRERKEEDSYTYMQRQTAEEETNEYYCNRSFVTANRRTNGDTALYTLHILHTHIHTLVV